MLKQHFRLNDKYFIPHFTIGTEIELEQVINYNKGCSIENSEVTNDKQH